MEERNAGIDYGLGKSNVDPKTGIRYGVISQRSLQCEAASEVFVEGAVYTPCCPHCYEPYEAEGDAPDTCPACGEAVEDWEYGDEPAYIEYHEGEGADEIIILDCLGTDFMVIKSPFTATGPFCSPCVPGAVNLDDTDGTFGARCYCLPDDWFEGGKAPYKYQKGW